MNSSLLVQRSRVRARLKAWLPILWAFFRVATATAQGGPPMLTDDPGTSDRGKWQMNLAWTVTRADSQLENEAPLIDINYGLRDDVELNYAIPWIVTDGTEPGPRSGAGNSLLGVKWRFIDRGERALQVSVHPQVEVGNGRVGQKVAPTGARFILPFQFRKGFREFALSVEIGRSWHSQENDEWFGGAVLGRNLSERLEFMLELHGVATAGLERSAIAVNSGFRLAFSKYGALLMSVGRDVRNDVDGFASVFGYTGWQWTL